MKYLIAILLCLAVVRCGEPVEEQYILPPDDVLIDLLIDMHLAEIPMARVPQESRDSIGTLVRTMIARKHNMTGEEMERFVAELQLNPDKFLAIYDSVAVRLEQMKNQGQ